MHVYTCIYIYLYKFVHKHIYRIGIQAQFSVPSFVCFAIRYHVILQYKKAMIFGAKEGVQGYRMLVHNED